MSGENLIKLIIVIIIIGSNRLAQLLTYFVVDSAMMPTEECSNKYPVLQWDLHQLHPDSVPFHEAPVYVHVILGNY